MRFLILAAALLMAGCSAYDDSELRSRIEKVEQELSRTNSDLEALKTLVAIVQQNQDGLAAKVYVTKVEPFTEDDASGWMVYFTSGDPIKIYNGKDGKDGKDGTNGTDGINGTNGTNGKDGKDGKDGDSLFYSVEVVGGNVVITLMDGTVYTIPLISMQRNALFEEDKIVLSLAAISDVHIGNGYGSEAKFTSALQQLKAKAAVKDADGLDAVMIVGDMVNTVSQSQITTLKTLYEEQFNPVKVPMIYTIGNHDMNSGCKWSSATVESNKPFRTILGDNYFLTDQDQTARIDMECRHCVVGDFHILCITPFNDDPVLYDPNALTWLDTQLKAITDAEPDRYVLLLTHPMIYATVYGSYLGSYWYTQQLTSILVKYPQVITFGGHLHFPLNDPRSIWQGDFTAMGCASVSYMAFEGGDYENKSSATVLNDAGEYSEGLLVQFDVNGNMRATRMDFYRSAEIGKAWEISHPNKDKTHLDKYNHASLAAKNSAPVLSTATVTVGAVSDGKANVSVTFAAATDDELVHHYRVSLKMGSKAVVTKNYMADFYRCPQPSQMKSEWTVDLGSVAEGKYALNIVAVDSWDAASTPLVKEVIVGTVSADTSFWTNDSAGSKAQAGGSGTVNGSWLSYSDGTVSWTANTTGAPRKEEITLPDGSKYTVTQLEEKDFKGNWTFKAKRFGGSNKLGLTNQNSSSADVVFGAPLSGTPLADVVSGQTVTNNIGITGLFSTAVMDASVKIDYDFEFVRLGLFFDERSAQSVNTGDGTYPYAYFAPELGASFIGGAYNFSPCPFATSQNYGWVWFEADPTLQTFKYNKSNAHKWLVTGSLSNYYVVGISVLVSKTETPASGSLRSPNSSAGTAGYDLIYQANFGYGDSGVSAGQGIENGMTFTKK